MIWFISICLIGLLVYVLYLHFLVINPLIEILLGTFDEVIKLKKENFTLKGYLTIDYKGKIAVVSATYRVNRIDRDTKYVNIKSNPTVIPT